jgi:hypothetical protein
VRGGEQGGVIGLGHAAVLPFAAAVSDQPVVQVSAATGPVGEQSGDLNRRVTSAATPANIHRWSAQSAHS